MKLTRLSIAVVSAALAMAAHAAPDNALVKTSAGKLVTTAGMTVYTFDKDVADSGKSACVGPCATNWPAVMAGDMSVVAPYSVVMRDEGKQLAYKGKPLYTYKADEAGSAKGEGFRDVWHTVKD